MKLNKYTILFSPGTTDERIKYIYYSTKRGKKSTIMLHFSGVDIFPAAMLIL